MTPKEKAEQLVSDFYSVNSKLITPKNMKDLANRYNLVMPISKQSALIAVEEIINVVKRYETKKGKLLIDNINLLYWQEVKQEMQKL